MQIQLGIITLLIHSDVTSKSTISFIKTDWDYWSTDEPMPPATFFVLGPSLIPSANTEQETVCIRTDRHRQEIA